MIKLGLWILVGLTAFRYWNCFQAPISGFEAYLRMCAHRLDFAFFDGPAGPATLVYLGNKFFTHDLLALRWSAPLFSILTTVACYLLGKRLYGIFSGVAAALLINILPIFQISSIQPESTIPALGFWLLGIRCIWNALKTIHWGWWLAAGIALALGLQFSYWLLLAPISCILCIFLGKRSYLSNSSLVGLGTLLIFCLIALAGPIEWNIRQDWLPFTGWTWQTLLNVENPYESLTKHLKQISLPGAFLGLLSLALCLRAAHISLRSRFLTAFIIPPLVATLFLITRNELGPLLFALAPLFVWLGGCWQTSTSPTFSWTNAVACGLTALCTTLSLMKSPSLSDKSLQKAAITVEKIVRTQSALFPSSLKNLFLIAETPSIVSEFGYIFDQLNSTKKKSGSRYEIFLRESPDLSHQFRLWPSYSDFADSSTPTHDLFFTEQKGINRYLGRSALYITSEEGLIPQTISAAFEKIIPLQTLQISGNGQRLRRLYIYFCRNYQTLPL